MEILVSHGIKSRLEEWMEAEGLNYSTLAAAIGIDKNAVSRLAKNQFERVDCTTWKAVCRYFGKPLNDLFYDSEDS
jgi:DNA-binding Xre family transcriptional regulator